MSNYGIQLVNKSGQQRRFFFFTAPPVVSNVPNVYSNTWITRVADDTEAINIKTTLDFYAWCGPSIQDDGQPTQVNQGVYKGPVTLGLAGTAGAHPTPGTSYQTLFDESSQHFGFGPPVAAAANPGCYSIRTDTNFVPDDNLILGLAMQQEGADMPAPVAIVKADPGLTYNIAPVVRFYVGVGDAETGDVIDFNAISTISGCYDFSATGAGFGHIFGTISYMPNGTWTQTVYKDVIPYTMDSLIPSPSNGAVEIPPWVTAVITFALPIMKQVLRDAVLAAVKKQLQGLNLTLGPFTFSSDGNTITGTYRLPGLEQYEKPKPNSEIWISVDAKNEIFQVKFTPHWAPESDDDCSSAVTRSSSKPAVRDGPSTDVIKAINTGIGGVSGLPKGESWIVS
ncbi:hypothetical protein TWF696_007323 [Orbilia brochopaga]|uniref:Uncharacterized protein n=1 Tax=Orbilia brochopaga TaxID=3140254 RepID=A0AAV9URZ4_9PEZI